MLENINKMKELKSHERENKKNKKSHHDFALAPQACPCECGWVWVVWVGVGGWMLISYI
jgi:hypothetical protein